MKHYDIYQASILSAALVGCSGDRPSFPDYDASTQTTQPSSATDAAVGGSSSSIVGAESGFPDAGTDGISLTGADVDGATTSQERESSSSAPDAALASAGSSGDDESTTSKPNEVQDSSIPDADASIEDNEDGDATNTNEDSSGVPSVGEQTSGDEQTSDDEDTVSDEQTSVVSTTGTSSSSESSTSTATNSTSTASTSSSNQTSTNDECIPAPRDCNSAEDNDCDGEADNTIDDVCKCEPDDVQACETHPNLDGKGICRAGSQTCVVLEGGGSDWEECEGSVGPEEESCTGNDDEDCDDQVNEAESCPCAANPCQNGGTCEAVASGYTCDCSETDFAGDNCDEARAIVLPRGPGNSDCRAVTLSNDGSVVGATCGDRPAYWTANSGWQYLIAPQGYFMGQMVDVSANGQVFVASMDMSNDEGTTAVRWSSRNGTGTALAGGTGDTFATGVSSDGQRTIGYGSDPAVLVWTGNGSAALYSAPADANITYSAVDADGGTVWSSNVDGTELLRWTGASSRTALPTADVFQLNVTGVSEDGQVVVGTGWPSASVVAVWRFVDNELVWLNAGGAVLCYSYGKVSADASRVAGWCLKPVVWLGDNQLDIQTYLAPIIADLDADIDQGTTAMRSMSGDGRYSVGDDFTRVFLVRLPNP